MPSKSCKRFMSAVHNSWLVLYSYFSALSGLVLVLAGVFISFFWSKLNIESSQDDLLTTTVGCIVIGVILTILPLILCCATVNARENWIAIMYLLITLVMLMMEMSLGIYLSVVPERTINKTRKSLTATFDRSLFNNSFAASYSRPCATVDMIQLHFHCCGVDGPQYWIKRNMNSLHLPMSCCEDVGQNLTCSQIKAWPGGCLLKSVALVTETSHLLFAIIISIAVVQVFGSLFFVIRHDWNGKELSESSHLLYTNNR